MALRSLDNALPITPERPKKQAKTIISAHKEKQSDHSGNDENKAPLPQPDATIEYIPSENLKPFQDPTSKIRVFVNFSLIPFLDLMNL